MKEQLIKIVQYLDCTIKVFNTNIKRYKILGIGIVLLILGLLQSYSIINLRNSKSNYLIEREISKDLKKVEEDYYTDMYTYMSDIEINYQVSSMYKMYIEDLEYSKNLNITKDKIDSVAKKIETNIDDSQMKSYMDTLTSMFSFDTKQEIDTTINDVINSTRGVLRDLEIYTDQIKPTNNTKFKEDLFKTLDEIDNKNTKSVAKLDDGYIVQKVPTYEKQLIDIIDVISKYNYIIYSKNIPIGYITTKDNKLSINMLDLETKQLTISRSDMNSHDILNSIPKGFPNVIIIYKDGTIDISEIILDILQYDKLSSKGAIYSNIRVIETNNKDLQNIKKVLDKYKLG